MTQQPGWHGSAHYQIKVKGCLGRNWSDWFEGMTIESKKGITAISCKVMDQAALHGLLTRIRDLGLPLLSVNRADLNDSKNS